MWIGDCSVALIGTHVSEPSAELLAPEHRFAGAATRAEILCTADFGTEAGNEIAVTSKTIDREHDFAGNDALPLAIDRLDISTDHAAAAVGQECACTIADGQRDSTCLHCPKQIVDQILTAARRRRVQPGNRMADMLVGGHQGDPRADSIGEPFDRRR